MEMERLILSQKGSSVLLSSASSRHRKERRSGKTKIPKVFINTWHKEDGDAGSRAVCGICRWALVRVPSLPQSKERCELCPGELPWGHWQKMEDTTSNLCLMARRQRRGSCPVHRKAFIKRFSMSWVSKTPAPKVQSFALSVYETVFFCASLCIPVLASPCRSHQHPQLALEMDRSIPNRDYLLCWKHQSVSQGICSDHLVWYWPLWKQLCWALVKFQNFGVIL